MRTLRIFLLPLSLLLCTSGLFAAPVMTAPWRIVDAGPTATEEGLRDTHAAGVGHVFHPREAGQACWSTDRRHGLYKIAAQGPPLPTLRVPMAVTVTVNYLDRGTGQWALEYDATTFLLDPFRTHSRVIQNHNTEKWKTENFFLPDAALCSAPTGWWLAVDSFGEMTEEDDVYVGAISVQLGGVAVVASTPVAAPGEPVTLHSWVYDAQGEPEAAHPAGASVTLTAPDRPGSYAPGAWANGAQAAIPLLVWPGHGTPQIESVLIDTANQLQNWAYWPVAAEITSGRVREADEDAGSWLHYRFTGAYWPGYVDLTKRTALRGVPTDLNVEVRGETGGARLEAILEDETGQRFCYPLGELLWPEWTPLRVSLRGLTRYWGGAADGVPHYPLNFLSLRLVQGPEGSAAAGQVELRNVFVRTLAPGP
jgi:hypothetical protein